jgi:hypothetical protein
MNDALAAFELTKPLLASSGLLEFVTAAYRNFAAGDFTVIWPIGHNGKFTV